MILRNACCEWADDQMTYWLAVIWRLWQNARVWGLIDKQGKQFHDLSNERDAWETRALNTFLMAEAAVSFAGQLPNEFVLLHCLVSWQGVVLESLRNSGARSLRSWRNAVQ